MKKRIIARMIIACMLFGMLHSDAAGVQAAEQAEELFTETEQEADMSKESQQAEELPVETEQTEDLSADVEQSDDPADEEQGDDPADEEQGDVPDDVEQTGDTVNQKQMDDSVDEEKNVDDPADDEIQTKETETSGSGQRNNEERFQEADLKPDEELSQMDFPTGLIIPDMLDTGEIGLEEVFEGTENCDPDIIRSYVYLSEWDRCSTNYFYNLLTEEEKQFWEELDAMCLKLLCTTENVQPDYFGYRTQYVECGNFDVNRAKILMMIFRYANPQYYFLDAAYRSGHDSYENYFVAFGIYSAFADGNARQAATQAVKSKYDEWLGIIGACQTEAEKVKTIHDLIINKVDYNYDIFDEGFKEDTSYTQSVYSVFCMDTTVCAGYSQAFEMLCNAAGVDCIAVTSRDHGWNKVRINDSWYNVDCTWADQATVSYRYFERSDVFYDTEGGGNVASHAESEFWLPYLPVCSLDSNATHTFPGVLPVISRKTAAPEIKVIQRGSYCEISLSSQTPGALIYYTVNGVEPTPAFTKSLKYNGTFTIDKSCTVKAVAVCDTYWDSDVVSTEATVQRPVYTISFKGNGAVSGSVGNITYREGTTVKMPANSFSRNGYEFTGWNTREDGSGKSYAAGQQVGTTGWTGDMTLYAQWRAGTDSENKACFVALLYENVLERDAEDSEIQHWVNELENGRPGAEIAYFFIFSEEFQNKGFGNGDYVERLYMSLMGRKSDSGGKRDWITRLENGVSREYVLMQFIGSVEFTNKCESYHIVRGDISLSEARDRNYDVTRFVARNYTQFLGRDYETDGLNYWCGMIGNRERTMQEVAFGFVFSAECGNKNLSNEEFVKMLYRGCFDREGDENGVAYWTGYLDSGQRNREEVFYGFANSREFDNMVHSYGL